MNNETNHFITGDGVKIAFRADGDPQAEPLLLSNSIATDLAMWDRQMETLAANFYVVRYDSRGHGASDAPATPYSLDRLGHDALELLDALQIERAHVLGLSLGGMVGQWLAIHAPDRVAKLVLSNTAAYFGPAPVWNALIRQIMEADSMDQTAESFLENWFPRSMIEAGGAEVTDYRRRLRSSRPEGIAGCWAAVRDADLRRPLKLIESRTLVIAGRDDRVTTVEHASEIANGIPGARLDVLDCVHLPNVEIPSRFNELIIGHLRD